MMLKKATKQYNWHCRIRIGIEMEIRIRTRIDVKTLPIHTVNARCGLQYRYPVSVRYGYELGFIRAYI